VPQPSAVKEVAGQFFGGAPNITGPV